MKIFDIPKHMETVPTYKMKAESVLKIETAVFADSC